MSLMPRGHESGGFGGLYAIANGFALIHGEADYEKIRLETPIYDTLYAWRQSQVAAAVQWPLSEEVAQAEV